MFQGSQNVGDYLSNIIKLGTRETNGTTSQDRTNYYETVPAGSLERVLWMESDRLATLADAMTQAKLDNQREVVRNQRRQSYENRPYGRAFQLINAGLVPEGHPYSWSPIGSHEDLQAAKLEDVKEFFRTFYTPNNLSLTVAGSFDPAEAKRLVQKYFGPIPPGPALERPKRWVPKLDGEKIVEAKDRVPQERTYMVWPAPPYFGEDEAALDLAGMVLSDGLSSRLTKTLVYDRQLSTDVSAGMSGSEIAGMFMVVSTARPGSSLAQIESIVTDEIARLAKGGPTADELKRAKAKQEFAFVSGLESLGGFGGKADTLNRYNTYLGDPGMFGTDLERYRRVTPADVKNAVAKWVDTRNRLLVHFRPETASASAPTDLDRSKAPPISTNTAFQTPPVQAAKLANGMEVYVVERHDLPMVSVALAGHAGIANDPPDKLGAANLTFATMVRGTKKRNALQIEDETGDLGTMVAWETGRQSSSLSMEALKRNLDPAFAVLADVARNPSFPQNELDREKKEALDNLSQALNSPGAIAGRVAPMLAFGREHPYGWPDGGFPATVQKITRDDLVRFYDANWKPGGMALFFTGDITPDEAKALAEKYLGDWQGAAPSLAPIPAPKPVGPGKIYLIDKPGAAQTVIQQILPGVQRASPDYYPLYLANAVWGGSYNSRLNLNLRQAKGYAYGAGSSLRALKEYGAWVASSSVQTDKTKESVVEFVKEMNDLIGPRPVSDAELTDAKNFLVQGYAQQFGAIGSINGQMLNLWALGLPMSELQRAPAAMEAATPEAVNAAAKKYDLPAQSTLLLVGDRAKIEPGLRSLNLGEIVVLDAEGNPVSG
jgi:zinc protease